jgi:putative Ca2+/H+ antiporter (TMEM165/GDT1 family)
LKKPLPEHAELLMFGKKSAKSFSENHEAKLESPQDPGVEAAVVDGDVVVTTVLVETGDADDVVTAALAVVEGGAVVDWITVVTGAAVVAMLAVVSEVPEHSQ